MKWSGLNSISKVEPFVSVENGSPEVWILNCGVPHGFNPFSSYVKEFFQKFPKAGPYPEAHSKPSQKSKTRLLTKIVKPLTIFTNVFFGGIVRNHWHEMG